MAPIGQKYLHHPRSIKKISIKNRIKIISAYQKNAFGTNFPGYTISNGKVPTNIPVGQTSVNINFMKNGVIITVPIRTKYFIYLK